MEDGRKTGLRQMEDCRQPRSGGLLAVARNPSGIIRRATKQRRIIPEERGVFSRTFPEEFPNKRVVFPNKPRTGPEETP
jgi:hypothetical protein